MSTDTEALDYRHQVGARLRAARERCGLSLREVAARFSVSHGAVGHWETGQNPIDLDTLNRLAKLYGTTVVALVADRLSNEDLLELTRRQLGQTVAPALPAPNRKRDGTGG